MASSGLQEVSPGQFSLAGPVGFASAGALLAASEPLFAGEGPVQVDMAGVTEVDSAGLALLLEWLSMARRSGRAIRFTRIPDKLRALARLSGVEEMLADGESLAGSPGT